MESNITTFIEDIKSTLSSMGKFKEKVRLDKAYTLLLIMFVVALLPFPYEFYVTLRVLTCIGLFIFISEVNKQCEVGAYKLVLIGLVVLYNPLFVVHLGSKMLWAVVSVVTLYFLFLIRCRVGGG